MKTWGMEQWVPVDPGKLEIGPCSLMCAQNSIFTFLTLYCFRAVILLLVHGGALFILSYVIYVAVFER